MIDSVSFKRDGFDIVLSIDYDDTYVSDPRDNDEGMSDEAARYWRDNRWHYVVVKVTASREGIELGTEYMGGVEYGEYDSKTWLGTDEVRKVAIDEYEMDATAIANAREVLAKLCAS